MALSTTGGGYHLGDGNRNTLLLKVQQVPATATVTATLTVAQLIAGILLGSPSTSAATYTLPTVEALEAVLNNATIIGDSFDISVCNVDGSGSGVITLAVGTGWTIVGLATIAATAGTAGTFRAVKTGAGTWTLYRLA
jgi:hypothetical protein